MIIMGWFRKRLNDEVNDLIKKLGVSKKFLSEEWTWKDPKLKGLHQLEEIDLEIIRKIRKLHRLVKDNPKIYERIMLLSTELKKDLDNLIKLKNLSTSLSKEKLSLAKKIVSELEELLKEEIEEERLIKGMTKKQAEKLGIEVKSFYTVQDKDGLDRIEHGKGVWPTTPTKAHFGPGVYTFNNLKAALGYRKLIIDRCISEGIKIPELFIISITFSKRSLKDFKPFDVDLLDSFEVGGTERWLDKYSSLFTDKKKINTHGKKVIIRGTGNFGKEYYFRPECLEDAAIELVA